MEGMEQSPPHVTLEANVVWENLERILSPNYELNGEKMCSSKMKKTGNSPKPETKDVLDYFDEPFSPTNVEKICSSKLKKPGKSPKLEAKDVLDYFDEPFSPTNCEKICSSKLKKPGKSPKQMSDEIGEDVIEWKWPSFSGMEPVVIQNGVASVRKIDDTMEDTEQSLGHEGGGNLGRYFNLVPSSNKCTKFLPSIFHSFNIHYIWSSSE